MSSLPSNLSELRALINQDRKKAVLLGGLTLAFIVVLAKSFGGGAVTAETAAAITPGSAKSAANAGSRGQDGVLPALGSPAVRHWIDAPIPPMTRNLFALDLTQFRAAKAAPIEVVAPVDDNDEKWSAFNAAQEARNRAEQLRRQRANQIREEASSLLLQQTWVGSSPEQCTAVINGDLLRPGQSVVSFRLIQVGLRTAILEKEGVRVEISMQRR